MNGETLQPQHHAPPDGWPAVVFERVTDALAVALFNTYRRDQQEKEQAQ